MNCKKFFDKNKALRIKKFFYLIVHIFCTNNNTIITITDKLGNTISCSTAYSNNYKNYKKSLSYSSQVCAENLLKPLKNNGLKSVDIIVKGFGPGREFSIKGLYNTGININSISDNTSIPHNGCKPKRLKRN